MKRMIIYLILSVFVSAAAYELGEPQIEFKPKTYAAPKIDDYLLIDGRMEEAEWTGAVWTDDFIDIRGEDYPQPYFKTRVKMLWNEYYFYIGAYLSERHVWGTLQKHDSVIFYDNDFEIFIDPDGDTHNYFEIEINALGTVWDLLLLNPYRDGGQVAIDNLDIGSLQSAVYVDGSINDPTGRDVAWYVEMAIPWDALAECAPQSPPEDGDFWRVNFSRVQWQHKIIDGKYKKMEDTSEDNWVWSPQGLINMHYPEMWGYVFFVDKMPSRSGKVHMYVPEEEAKWLLRQVYYKNYQHYQKFGRYTENIEILGLKDIKHGYFDWPPVIEKTTSLFEAYLKIPETSKTVHINNKGKTWLSDTSQKE